MRAALLTVLGGLAVTDFTLGNNRASEDSGFADPVGNISFTVGPRSSASGDYALFGTDAIENSANGTVVGYVNFFE